jgi:hypothetical protein
MDGGRVAVVEKEVFNAGILFRMGIIVVYN